MSKNKEGSISVKVIFGGLLYETDMAWLVGDPSLDRHDEPKEPTDRVWLPKFYKDGRDLVAQSDITRLKGGLIEVVIPTWLAESKEIIDFAHGLDPEDMIMEEEQPVMPDWKPPVDDDIPF